MAHIPHESATRTVRPSFLVRRKGKGYRVTQEGGMPVGDIFHSQREAVRFALYGTGCSGAVVTVHPPGMAGAGR